VPDLVATDSRLALAAQGSLGGKAFTILGHLQLGHGSAGSVWDEWYAGFSDGSWGWLAEAQGHLLFTRHMAGDRKLPRFEGLSAGKRIVNVPGAGTLVIDEVNEARFAAAEGELPFRPALGAVYRFADCSTPEGGFVTLDYGVAGEAPEMFAGREITYAEAGLAKFQPPLAARSPEGRALTCPSCGGPLTLKLEATESVTCPGCHSLLDVTQPAAKLLQKLKARSKPPLPLGARGTIEGHEYEVIGWMKRSVRVDGTDYFWDEYLLHGDVGFRWLSESEGHWLFLSPVPAGKVEEDVTGATCDGRHFKDFQEADARYVELQGEFYWRVEADKSVHTADYVAPPYILSKEQTREEINWSRGEYLSGGEVWKIFAQPGRPPFAPGVGAAQPNPYRKDLGRAWMVCLYALVAAVAFAIVWSAAHPREELMRMQVPVGQVALSEPFEIAGGPQAIAVLGAANVDQSWIGMDVALINDDTGDSDSVGLELSYYHGYDDGAWSEGSPSGSTIIGRVPDGRYVLRAETVAERGPSGSLPSVAELRLQRGVFLAIPFVLAVLLIMAVPIWLTWRSVAFEKERWAQSDHPWSDS
ncbi:MAG: DUF4178 domain-containing protein, partial [Myxococcales bacterium]